MNKNQKLYNCYIQLRKFLYWNSILIYAKIYTKKTKELSYTLKTF